MEIDFAKKNESATSLTVRGKGKEGSRLGEILK